MSNQPRRRRRRKRQRRQRQGGRGGLLSSLGAAVKLGLKLGRDKRYKRTGAIGARGHYKSNPRPWAV